MPRFHPLVRRDVSSAIRHYDSISDALGDDFWEKFEQTCREVDAHPERFHFDPSDWRRANLEKLPTTCFFTKSLMACGPCCCVMTAETHVSGCVGNKRPGALSFTPKTQIKPRISEMDTVFGGYFVKVPHAHFLSCHQDGRINVSPFPAPPAKLRDVIRRAVAEPRVELGRVFELLAS